MSHVNIEVKAKCDNLSRVRNILKKQKADFKGLDHQIDTYFRTSSGRLKLREGNIENYLIYYEREDKESPKKSKVALYKHEPGSSLKELLSKSLGVLAIVDKKREIYFIGNVKFHLDKVKDLGSFIEIEAIDNFGNMGVERLAQQCQFYVSLFKVREEDLVSCSYSDLLLHKKQ
jgi:adenylate cyclase class 2